MARKKPPEEHENLERWMVSYADFLTLLFATFVVLYALSQINLEQFKELQLSIKKAFTAPSIMQGDVGVMNQGQNIIDNSNANAMIDSLMLEYVSPTYEQESFEEIKEDIEALNKTGELDGVNATIDERGLVINMNDDGILFKSGSADLSNAARKKLDLIGKLIIQKFAMHQIRIEGHSDKIPSTGRYPSNWELSSARASSIARYLIGKFKFLPDLFTVVGYADTRPVIQGNSSAALAKNRRVEIVVLRNQNKRAELSQDSFIKMDKAHQQQLRNEQIEVVESMDKAELQKIENKIKQQEAIIKEQEPTRGTASDFRTETDRLRDIR